MAHLPLKSNGMYATVDQVKDELKSADGSINDDIFAFIEQASARIEADLSTSLEPVISTRYFDAGKHDLVPRSNLLLLDYPLLELTSLTLGDGTVLTASDYRLEPRNLEVPYNAIHLINYSFYSWTDSPYQAIAINGVWGWRTKMTGTSYWVSVTTLSANVTTTTATTIAVTSGTNIQAGMLLKVGSEYMRVSSVSGNNVTVERGKNGSTASTHTSGDAVYYFQWDYALNRACIKLTAYMYHRRGAYEQTTFDLGTGVSVQYPNDIPLEVQAILRTAMPPRIIRTV